MVPSDERKDIYCIGRLRMVDDKDKRRAWTTRRSPRPPRVKPAPRPPSEWDSLWTLNAAMEPNPARMAAVLAELRKAWREHKHLSLTGLIDCATDSRDVIGDRDLLTALRKFRQNNGQQLKDIGENENEASDDTTDNADDKER